MRNGIQTLNKMNIFSKIIVFIIAITLSACYKNSVERNTIVFKDRVGSVQDSLLKIKGLLAKLPERSDNLNINYIIKNKKLYTNYDFSKGSIIEVGNPYGQFKSSEKKDFITLALYLNKNFISAAYFDRNSAVWRFIYREKPDITYNDSRDIVVLTNEEAASIRSKVQVLDQKGKIYLVAPADAKIR